MAGNFKFELVSPERLLVSEDVESVVIPGGEGEMTVLSNHAPLMTTIKPGVITVAVSESVALASGLIVPTVQIPVPEL